MTTENHKTAFGIKGAKCFFQALIWMFALGSTQLGAQTNGTVTYVYTDPQGTPLAEADVNGNIIATYDYTPYGTVALGTPPRGPGYTGHVNDPETGLVYMQARYFDPVTGGFLSVDPVPTEAGNIFKFNRFGYADNNPIIKVDRDGRESASLTLRGLAAIEEDEKQMSPEEQGQAVSLVASAIPGVGDIQNVAEMIQDPTPSNVMFAIIGAVPEGGVIISMIAKEASVVKSAAGDAAKLSKVEKSVKVEQIGGFTKKTEVRPGKGPGQSRAEYVRVKNSDGKTIRTYKDSYDRAGKFQGRKPLTGGPEGRPAPPLPPQLER